MQGEKKDYGFVVVILVFALGIFLYFSQNNFSDSTGAFVTGQTGSQCEDTDNVLNELEDNSDVFVVGTVRTRTSPNQNWIKNGTDKCFGNLLNEYYCTSGGIAANKTITCDYGCWRNRCRTPVCGNSDFGGVGGGANYTKKGTTAGLMSIDALGVPPISQKSKTYVDKCNSKKLLVEYYCGNGLYGPINSIAYDCELLGDQYSCLDGLCYPGGKEKCDGEDNDGDSIVDEGCDDDNDSVCDSTMPRADPYKCTGPHCCSKGGGDCDDTSILRRPGLKEDCSDKIDNDCNGVVNDGCPEDICDNFDNDGDGLVDNGCDEDNDDYCKLGKTLIGIPSICPKGGGDCDDNSPIKTKYDC